MAAPATLVLRLSVPSEGPLRAVAPELASRVAEYVDQAHDGPSVAAALENAAAGVCTPGHADPDIEFVFRQAGGDLVIEARCGGRASQVRCILPS